MIKIISFNKIFLKFTKGGTFLKEKTIYFEDELNDEFSGVVRNTIKIDGDFEYIKKSSLWNLTSFFVYRIIMLPFAWLYTKIKFKHKIVNKKVLKQTNSGYFMYGNHTLMGGDAFIPNMVNLPKKTYTIVHPDNLSKFGLKNFLQMNGALPLPATTSATKNFIEAIEKRVIEGHAIQIYPEAHIWPYYTKIRPFKSTSFRYPVKFDEPTYCFTNTFHKRKFSKKPKVITYVDGPFYPNKDLPLKEREQDLRDRVYETMRLRSELNTYEYIKYEKKENTND